MPSPDFQSGFITEWITELISKRRLEEAVLQRIFNIMSRFIPAPTLNNGGTVVFVSSQAMNY